MNHRVAPAHRRAVTIYSIVRWQNRIRSVSSPSGWASSHLRGANS